MKASVAIHVRVSPAEARLLKRAGRINKLKLATFVREAAVAVATECEKADARIAEIAAQGGAWTHLTPHVIGAP